MRLKVIPFFFIFFHSFTCDMIVFCHSRPMQLHLFLTSVKKFVKGLSEVLVLHDHFFQDDYFKVKRDFFADATFVNVYQPAQLAIKSTIERCISDYESEYLIIVDCRVLVKDVIDINEYIKRLNASKFFSFTPFKDLNDFKFSMILLKKKDLIPYLESFSKMVFTASKFWPDLAFLNEKDSYFDNNKKVAFINYLGDISLWKSKFESGCRLNIAKYINSKSSIVIHIKDV